jgi:hypothetical protein
VTYQRPGANESAHNGAQQGGEGKSKKYYFDNIRSRIDECLIL